MASRQQSDQLFPSKAIHQNPECRREFPSLEKFRLQLFVSRLSGNTCLFQRHIQAYDQAILRQASLRQCQQINVILS
jgi:hypothetical protein